MSLLVVLFSLVGIVVDRTGEPGAVTPVGGLVPGVWSGTAPNGAT